VLFTWPFGGYNAGCLEFGPDGYLYIGMGDGGSGGDPNNYAQNPMSLLGKMLRIDVHHGNTYKIPADNPFVDSTNYRPEIWAVGVRNPWRWSFDALNGDMYIADVGQDNWEEIDIQPKGEGGNNYGWRCYEGKYAYNTDSCNKKSFYTFPVYAYDHSNGNCSINGGFVYRGSLYPSLYGKYFFTDYCSGMFRYLYTKDTTQIVKSILNGDNNAYTAFGENAARELYVCNYSTGVIYHITDAAPLQTTEVTEANSSETERLNFSPNPSKGIINISYNSSRAQQITIRVTGITGQQFYKSSRSINAGNNAWNINLRIPKGMYYISVINNEGSIITRSLKIE